MRDAENARQNNENSNEQLAQQLSEIGDDDEEAEAEEYDPNDLHASDEFDKVLPQEEEEVE
jgi:hypothetical protein